MSHEFPLAATPPQLATEFGGRTAANRENFPILQGLSLYRLQIHAGCFRESHWHANADELGYCLLGQALVTIFSSGNEHEQFFIREGEMFFVPSGSLHAIENLGDSEVHFLIFFDTPDVKDIGFSGAIPAFPDRMIAPTIGISLTQYEQIPRQPADLLLVPKTNPVD